MNMVKSRCEACEPADNHTVSEAARLAQLDMDTVMSRESYEAAMYAAGAACRAVDGKWKIVYFKKEKVKCVDPHRFFCSLCRYYGR